MMMISSMHVWRQYLPENWLHHENFFLSLPPSTTSALFKIAIMCVKWWQGSKLWWELVDFPTQLTLIFILWYLYLSVVHISWQILKLQIWKNTAGKSARWELTPDQMLSSKCSKGEAGEAVARKVTSLKPNQTHSVELFLNKRQQKLPWHTLFHPPTS